MVLGDCGLELVKLNEKSNDKTQLRYQLCLQSTSMCLSTSFLIITGDSDHVNLDPANVVIK